MSEARRAYNILRSYVNREWDRIKGLDVLDAIRELEADINKTAPQTEETEKKAETVEDEKKELQQIAEYTANARQILGVSEGDNYTKIRKAYERISRKAQPENFNEGSPEAQHADMLLRRATWAFQYLTRHLSATEKRFKSLEID